MKNVARRGEHRRPDPRVIHADAAILVVDKPAGVLSIPGRDGKPGLAARLREVGLLGSDDPLFIVHRLDRDASGVIVLARTPEAQRFLTEQFARRRVEKAYWALVDGYVREAGEIDLPLHIDKTRKRVLIVRNGGKPALTRYRIVERLKGHTLLECQPVTGRLHQIRVHLSAIGHPLAVDPLYGGSMALFLSQYKADYRPSRRHEELPLIDRLTLHALRLTLDHPGGTGPITFESPLPKDFRATLNQLRRLGT